MSRVNAPKIFLTLLVLSLAAGMLLGQAPPATPLTATPASVAVTYQKPATPGSTVTVTFKAASSTTFVVDASTVPFWLTVGVPSGPATSTGATVTFDPAGVAATLNAGGYNAFVHVKVSGFADLVVPISLTVSDPASSLSIAEGSALTIHWHPGDPYPTKTLTMVSSDAPLGFTVTTTPLAPTVPANWISVNHTSGIAYTYGTPITVSFLGDVLYNANVGDVLGGKVTVTPTGGVGIDFTYTIDIDEPNAAITSIFPSQAAVQSSNSIKVVVTGSGFGTTGGYSGSPTTVKIAYGSVAATDITTIGGAFSVANQNTLVMTIPYQDNAGTPNAILSAAGNVTISITNGLSGEVAATATLTVTGNPIVYAVTDAASITETAPGTNPTVAPYEIVTLWGDNLISGSAVNATLDSFSRYPTTLTASGHTVGVAFWNAAGSTKIADAYLLFASKTQINLMVPSNVTVGQTDRIVVTYNALASAASPAAGFPVTVAAENPGVFTTSSSGQGQGAILLADYSLNSSSNKAAAGTTVLIYMTGVGTPNSTALNSAVASKSAFPTTCISPASYMATINALATPPSPAWTTVDGTVIQQRKLTANHLPPCMATANAVTVSIGGKAATVSYAGWVGDSIAGLYQINAALAATTPSGTQPVVVTVGGVQSQTGVTMVVK